MVAFLLEGPLVIDEESWTKAVVKGKAAPEMLDAAADLLAAVEPWSAEAIRAAIEAAAVKAGLVNAEGGAQLSKAQGPVRVATTGRSVGPPLFEALEVLGRAADARSVAGGAGPPVIRRVLRLAIRGALVVGVVLILYVAFTFVQVFRMSRHDGAKKVDAIIVLGAAQYNGRPSPVLQARLDHALDLYNLGYAPRVVLTGGRQAGDKFTEATTGYNYLRRARRARCGAPQGGRRHEHVDLARGRLPVPPEGAAPPRPARHRRLPRHARGGHRRRPRLRRRGVAQRYPPRARSTRPSSCSARRWPCRWAGSSATAAWAASTAPSTAADPRTGCATAGARWVGLRPARSGVV